MSMIKRVLIGVVAVSIGTLGIETATAVADARRCASHPPASLADYQVVADGRTATWGVGDITSVVRLPDGRRLFTLGDTGYYDLKPDGSAGTLQGFGNNSAWVQSGNCWTLLDHSGPGSRSWISPPQRDGSVYWPGASVVVGSRLYVFLTRLHLTSIFGSSVGAAVAIFDLPSLQLARIREIPFSRARTFGGGAVYDGGYLYTYASQAQTCAFCFAGDMYVARVPEAQIQVPTAWRYRSGSSWVANPNAATPVLRAASSNTNVQPYGNGFLLITKTYSIIAPDVEAWWAPNPEGPWQDLGEVFSVPDPPSSYVPGFHYQQAFTYNPVVLASTRLHDGGFLASYNVNTFDPAEARRDGRMAGPRFVSIHVPAPPAAPQRGQSAPGANPWTPTFGVDRAGRVRATDGRVHLDQSYTSHAVAVARTSTGRGGWVAAADGGVFGFGDARFYGSMGGTRLQQPVVGIATTPTGQGYWLVARDGGIFGFGNARFYGSTGSIRLNQPIAAIAATPTGRGYWLVARDGGIFGFGDARFYGSTGSAPPRFPVMGIATTPDGLGYWLVTLTGQVYAFGRATAAGNLPSPISAACVGIVSVPGGYQLVDSAGHAFTRGALGGQTRIASPTPLVAAG